MPIIVYVSTHFDLTGYTRRLSYFFIYMYYINMSKKC